MCTVFRVSSFLTFYSVLIVGEKSAEENVLSQQSSLSEEVGARKFSGPHWQIIRVTPLFCRRKEMLAIKDISCQSFLMWKIDKHLVSTKYLRWIYAVHEYEHWAGSLSEELVCSKIWEAWWPKSWFLHKSTKPATRCGSFITNPAVELLATAAVNIQNILW